MKTIALVLALTLTACATMQRMNRVSVGMTKEQVVEALGTPDSSAAQGGMEFLRYELRDKMNYPRTHFVRIVDGKVESFGQMGDFDSAREPSSQPQLHMHMGLGR